MFNKLVRDKIPEIIEAKGEKAVTRMLSDEEYKEELEKKLTEEHNEVLASSGDDRIEELADLLEVMIALAKLEGKTLNDVINTCEKKREKKGSFDRKIYLENVIK